MGFILTLIGRNQMSNPHNIQIGQQLWYAPANVKAEAKPVTVGYIGRKWFGLERGDMLFNLETLARKPESAGYTSNGRIWLDKEEWHLECRREQLWQQLRGHFLSARTFRANPETSVENLEQVFSILHITPKETM